MRRICLFAVLALCLPAHANTITADGSFDIAYYEHGSIVVPSGTGSFSLRENRIVDFDLTYLGRTWDLDDVLSLTCPRYICSPDGDGQLDLILIEFEDGFLLWDFHQGLFSMAVLGLRGMSEVNSEGQQASGGFTSFSHSINIPEPGAALMFGLGLIGLALTRR